MLRKQSCDEHHVVIYIKKDLSDDNFGNQIMSEKKIRKNHQEVKGDCEGEVANYLVDIVLRVLKLNEIYNNEESLLSKF